MHDMVLAENMTIIQSGDADAVEIGKLYGLAGRSLVDSVRYAVECGQKLAAKKETLDHGEWLPWLAANADVLGFSSRPTASRLMKLAASSALAHHLDEPTAVTISRKLWGHEAAARTQDIDAIPISQLIRSMGRVAKFCETNDPKDVAKVIRREEIAALQSHARVIVAWLSEFNVQL